MMGHVIPSYAESSCPCSLPILNDFLMGRCYWNLFFFFGEHYELLICLIWVENFLKMVGCSQRVSCIKVVYFNVCSRTLKYTTLIGEHLSYRDLE